MAATLNAHAPAAGVVVAVSATTTHSFFKQNRPFIRLIAGRGVQSDAHEGVTVQHRSRVARDASQPNLRQVHLIHAKLFEELRQSGFHLAPGQLGENITTKGIDLLALPTGTRVRIGMNAIIKVTGLRNPCRQLDDFRPGLMAALVSRVDGKIIRKAGIMAIVIADGEAHPDDPLRVALPPLPHVPLRTV